jgi:excinuclease ABC subunit A
MTLAEAALFFSDHAKITLKLRILEQVGLGYLRLGQPLNTLSGGESQRLALAVEMMTPAKGKTLYLFDEPSSGLHFLDVRNLLILFSQLKRAGHTLLIIEHDRSMIAEADFVIELGPEGGEGGGFLMTSST